MNHPIAVCPHCNGIRIEPVKCGIDGSYKCADCGAGPFGLGDLMPDPRVRHSPSDWQTR